MQSRESGFTIVELLISTIVIVIFGSAFFMFFGSTFENFFKLQTNSMLVNNEAQTIARMSQVIRGGMTISAATNSSLTLYSYFSPQDSTLSQVTYYYQATSKRILVDRIPATGTAPNYTYPVANKTTAVLINGATLTGNLFTYQDANGGTGPFTTDTYKDIKLITIDLNSVVKGNVAPTELKTTIVLRNRKTNL